MSRRKSMNLNNTFYKCTNAETSTHTKDDFYIMLTPEDRQKMEIELQTWTGMSREMIDMDENWPLKNVSKPNLESLELREDQIEFLGTFSETISKFPVLLESVEEKLKKIKEDKTIIDERNKLIFDNLINKKK